MPKRLRRNVGKFIKTRRKFLKKNLSIFRLLLTKFESTKNTKKGQPILGQDKTLRMELKDDRIIIASDVKRDGIGIEVYRNDEIIIEIFRSDSERKRTIQIFKENVSLELMEKTITTFKKEIPWEFIADE